MRTTTRQTIRATTTTTKIAFFMREIAKVVNSPILKIKKKRHKI